MRFRSRSAWTASLAAVVVACGAPTAGPPTPSTTPPSTVAGAVPEAAGWRDLAPLADGPSAEEGVAAAGRDVYFVGGIVPGPNGAYPTVARVAVYHSDSDTWSDAAPLPVALNHPNVAAVDGKVYVLGGLAERPAPAGEINWRPVADSYVYDAGANRWTPIAPQPEGAVRGASATAVRGTTIYLAGGLDYLTSQGQVSQTAVSAYDTATNSWSPLPDLPEARDHVGGSVVGDTLYIVGGRDSGQPNVRGTVFALDLASNGGRWERRASMPTPRGGLATATVGETIYTFGGEGDPAPGTRGVYPQVESYDTRTDRWTRLPDMPTPRHGTQATSIGDTIYVPGGSDQQGSGPLAVNTAFRPG